VLDLPRTLEQLETLGVPVVGFGTDELPAFYVRSSGLRLAHRADDAATVARIARAQLEREAGMVVAVPIPEADALDRGHVEAQVTRALADAERQGIAGAALTPYLLRALGDQSQGGTLAANVALLRNNAAVAGRIAGELARV
jgi:pseudouridine-5'-phosphate glycosidase